MIKVQKWREVYFSRHGERAEVEFVSYHSGNSKKYNMNFHIRVYNRAGDMKKEIPVFISDINKAEGDSVE